ncbi:hypothetical protein RNI52_14045 [Labrys neptuniae]|uniref:HTH rpiR-type domain-containing protein n=1 Tax=Labrys neptuniae TaxID=376174 RepID=A0ABV3PPY0_9HYPH|nr:hypothetical protein [Labrys neptuniae]MDT3378447.1 hypothetical protein [Labrys neptuniae]
MSLRFPRSRANSQFAGQDMERSEHPRDLAELCQRFAEMRVGLKPWAQTAMDYALDNRLQVALGSARDMAKACGIPTSAVSRLVKLFGFRCFADFRDVFKQEIRFHLRLRRRCFVERS